MRYNTILFDFGDTLNTPHPTQHWALYDWVPSLITRLYYASYRLGIISNTSRYQDGWWVRNKLAENNILQHFEMIISSATYGVHKPDPAIFKKAIDFMQIDPKRTVMVGDSERCDGGACFYEMKYFRVKEQSDWSKGFLDFIHDDLTKTRKTSNLIECNIQNDKIICYVRHLSDIVSAGDVIVAKGREYKVLEVSREQEKDDFLNKHYFVEFKVKEIHG